MRFARGSLFVGGMAPVVFVVCAVVAGATQPGYSHSSGHLSGLAAVPAENRWLMVSGFVVLGVGVALVGLAIALIERSRIVPTTLVLAGATIVLLGLLPRDCVAVACDHPSWHHRGHDVASVPAYLFAAALPLVVAGSAAQLTASRWVAVLVVGTTGLILGLFVIGTFDRAGGLVQRLALLPPLVWLATASGRWATIANSPPRNSIQTN